MSSTRPTLNTLGGNRTFTGAHFADAATLAAICAPYWIVAQRPNGDPLIVLDKKNETLRAALAKAGFGFDSVGQAFKDGVLIPSPPKPSASGVGSQVPIQPLSR
jgi:hypothetical protein